MNPFAKPEEAMPYNYEDFPAPERAQADFSFADNPASAKFTPFDVASHVIGEEPLPIVQGLLLQDFKEVIKPVS
jgi:hypothetical protein